MSGVDINQIIGLIESLYTVSDTNQISQIQQSLQSLQKSDEGWIIGRLLLNSDSLNCKYFGALTYTVKINQSNKNLEQNQINEILNDLVHHLLKLINEGNPQNIVIIRKILSNLALIYIQIPNIWLNPILTLLVLLVDNAQPLNLSPCVADADLASLLPKLDIHRLAILSLFAQIIVEDVSKNTTSPELHQFIHENLHHSNELLLQFAFTTLMSNETSMNQSLDNTNSWIHYISYAELESSQRYDFKQLSSLLLQVMVSPNLNISQKAIDVVIEMLEIYPRLLDRELRQVLSTILFQSWGPGYLNTLMRESDMDAVNQFARLMIIFLECDTIKLAKQLIDDEYDTQFNSIIDLTNFPGLAIKDETVSRDFIEFWSQLADIYIDDDDLVHALLKDDGDAIIKFDKKKSTLFNQIARIYWEKIHLPENLDFLDSIDDEFHSYRRDVADFYETIYPIVRLPIYKNLIDNIITNLNLIENKRNLWDIEASLYLINSLSTNFNEDNINQEIISLFAFVFNSNLLGIISLSNNSYLVAATIRFLSSIDFFYQHKIGLNYLSAILEFLFNCLTNSSCELLTSKALVQICNDCRTSLIDYLPNFEELLVQVVNNISTDNLIRGRVINSYASIVQGIKDPVLQGERLNKVILLLIEKAYFTMSNYSDSLMDYLSSLLNCLRELGRAMQLPDDVDGYYTEEEQKTVIAYWTEDPLKIQANILSLISQLSLNFPNFVNNTEITEICCQILKSGLTESINGPFVFNNDDILSYVMLKIDNCNIDSVPFVYGLFDAIVTTNYRELSRELIQNALTKLFLNKYDTIKSDPDLVQASINVFGTLMDNKPNLILYFPHFQDVILKFCLDSLLLNEKFILRTVDKFWTKFLTLRRGDENDKQVVTNLMNNENLGQMLTFTLLKATLNSQRSNIEFFIDIFRVLIAKFPLNMKSWMNNSFAEINNSREQKIEKYELFISKLILTRGMRKSGDVIRDFWLETNGLINYNKR